MGTLSELDYGEEVLCEGEIFSWKRLGFDTPPSQLWQDAWLRMSIYTRAMLHPGLSDEDRDKVRRNAEIMFLGLRTFGVPFRVLT